MSRLSAMRVSAEGSQVALVVNGRLIAQCHWQDARRMAEAIRTQAKRAEEWDSRHRIISDQGLLHRLGIRLGLTGRRDFQREALKVAQHDPTLRRAMPNRIRPDADQIGTPTVIVHSQKPEDLDVRPAA